MSGSKKEVSSGKKVDEKKLFFKPTPAMQLFAFQIARLGKDASITEAAERVGVSRQVTYRWREREGFFEWLEEQVEVYRSPILEMIEQVAIKNLDDFRYWEAMALKYGFIVERPLEVKADGQMTILVPAMTKEQAKKLLEEKTAIKTTVVSPVEATNENEQGIKEDRKSDEGVQSGEPKV